jgi:hypothetical protein|tara:strand:- start:53 stop:604 length:552 start_codon:yes stop_codon:yes gene_type:complete
MNSDVSDLILAINTLGDDLVGLELGVARGSSLINILNNCNIKKLYGVDNWKPFADFLKQVPDGKPAYSITMETQEINKFLTYHTVKYSNQADKVEIIEKDSLEAVKEIPDKSLDFIFFDAMMTEKQSYEEAKAYYPKIKDGGLFTGHDASCREQVIKPIEKVKKEYNNTNKIIIYNDCFLFRV